MEELVREDDDGAPVELRAECVSILLSDELELRTNLSATDELRAVVVEPVDDMREDDGVD